MELFFDSSCYEPAARTSSDKSGLPPAGGGGGGGGEGVLVAQSVLLWGWGGGGGGGCERAHVGLFILILVTRLVTFFFF